MGGGGVGVGGGGGGGGGSRLVAGDRIITKNFLNGKMSPNGLASSSIPSYNLTNTTEVKIKKTPYIHYKNMF